MKTKFARLLLAVVVLAACTPDVPVPPSLTAVLLTRSAYPYWRKGKK
jgi:hypothetical protein